jgi:uncharacterized protein YcaQ
MPLSLEHLRRYAIARSLFKPTSLMRAIARLGFVQADPIRAPARAQDLILRHRVRSYRAGDLERRYPRLALEEDFFINYGFMPRAVQSLMHPRNARHKWTPVHVRQSKAVLDFVRERGRAHPRQVDERFAHGKITNWFGGSSNASTHLLDAMHYRGLLRVARRDGGTRVYAVREPTPTDLSPDRCLDTFVDLVAAQYAPLPATTLSQLVYRLRMAAPQWDKRRPAALARARERLSSAEVGGIRWYWPHNENPRARRWRLDERVRLLAPFDPVVWDRLRFEKFFDWAYRFEAYVPAPKRKLGYYALPMLWQGNIIGWGNVAMAQGKLKARFGYVAGKPPDSVAFNSALEEEVFRMREFLEGEDRSTS